MEKIGVDQKNADKLVGNADFDVDLERYLKQVPFYELYDNLA